MITLTVNTEHKGALMDWNNKTEFDKFVKLIMAMSTDYFMGNITQETYMANFIFYAQMMENPTPNATGVADGGDT
jgi:hypothetical protein